MKKYFQQPKYFIIQRIILTILFFVSLYTLYSILFLDGSSTIFKLPLILCSIIFPLIFIAPLFLSALLYESIKYYNKEYEIIINEGEVIFEPYAFYKNKIILNKNELAWSIEVPGDYNPYDNPYKENSWSSSESYAHRKYKEEVLNNYTALNFEEASEFLQSNKLPGEGAETKIENIGLIKIKIRKSIDLSSKIIDMTVLKEIFYYDKDALIFLEEVLLYCPYQSIN